MAVKLPTYKRQVSTSPESGGVLGSIAEAGASQRAAGQLGQQLGGMATDYFERKSKLKQEADEADYMTRSAALEGDIDQIKNEALQQGMAYSEIPGVIDKQLGAFEQVTAGLGYSDRSMKRVGADWPTRRQKIRTSVLGDIEKMETLELGQKVYENGKSMVLAGNEAGWDQISKLEGYLPQGTIEKMRSDVTHEMVTRDVLTNPQMAIEDMTAQLRGGEVKYEHADAQYLKSSIAYAKQQKTELSAKTLDDIYMPNSDYAKMDAKEQLAWLDDKRNKGLLTGKSWDMERKRVMEPAIVEITPEINQGYLDVQADIHAARGNKEKMNEALNRLNGMPMPNALRTTLYNEARSVDDPTSTFNQTASKLGRDLITDSFSRQKDDFAEGAVEKWFGLGGVKGFKEETRKDMLTRAEAEAQAEFSQWMYSQKEIPQEQQIQQKAYEILRETNKKYTVDQIPLRMEEISLEQMSEPLPEEVATDAAVVEELLSMEDFVADFIAEEGREPTEEEISQLQGKAWQ